MPPSHRGGEQPQKGNKEHEEKNCNNNNSNGNDICISRYRFAEDNAGNEVISAINKLDDIIFGIIKAIGMGFAAWGILNFASSISSHDSGQRMLGFTNVTTGLIAIFAKEILKAIGAM